MNVAAIGISFGRMHGYAISPARDFGPRLFSVLVGFKNNGLIGSTGWIAPDRGTHYWGLSWRIHLRLIH